MEPASGTKGRERRQAFRLGAWLLAALVAAYVFWAGWWRPEASMEWQPYSEAAVRAAQAAGQPVIIDFWADWCAPCHALERTVFSKRIVVDAAREFMRLRADLTETNSTQAIRLSAQYSIYGFPTVIFIGRDGGEIRSLRLHGSESPERFVRRLQAVWRAPG